MSESALRVLETGTRPPLPVLLPLLGAGIPRQKPGFLQFGTQLPVVVHQRPGKAVTDRSRLARHAASLDADVDVEFVRRLGEQQRLPDDELEALALEIVVHGAIVDLDLADAGAQKNTRRRMLPPPRAVILDGCHPLSPSFR